MNQTVREARTFFVCAACGLAYLDRAWAKKCEAFCKKHNACSLEIIRHAVSR